MRVILGALVLLSLGGSVQAAPCDGMCVTPTNLVHQCGDYTLLLTKRTPVRTPVTPEQMEAARKANEAALKRLKSMGGIITDLR